MYCRNCGFELKEKDKVCPGCGSPVVPLAADATPQGRVSKWEQDENFGNPEPKVTETGKKPVYVYDDGKEYKGQGYEDLKAPKTHYEFDTKGGKKAGTNAAGAKKTYNASGNTYTPSDDSGSFGWWILGCCVPIVGLILFLVWKDTKPKSAKMAGIGALVALIFWIVISALFVILGIGASFYYSDIFDNLSMFGIDI